MNTPNLPSWIDPARYQAAIGQTNAPAPSTPATAPALSTLASQIPLPSYVAPFTTVQEPPIVTEIRQGFKSVTWTLILTGVAIGLTSGFASTVGTALGTVVVRRFGHVRRGGRGR